MDEELQALKDEEMRCEAREMARDALIAEFEAAYDMDELRKQFIAECFEEEFEGWLNERIAEHHELLYF